MKESPMQKAKRRGDYWGLEVASRLSGIIDLVAEQAVYHIGCKNNFERNSSTTQVTNMNIIFKYLSIFVVRP